MDAFPTRAAVSPWRAMVGAVFAAMLCLAGCRPAADSAPAPAAVAVDSQAGSDAATGTSPAAPAALPDAAATTPAAGGEPDDMFVGWYFEQGGAGRLQACGQAVPLEVADATFLRQLKVKAGGGPSPVYVRLKVRLAPGAKLEVVDVQQFGVDEGPAPNCELVAHAP